jgi:hypothetical protein
MSLRLLQPEGRRLVTPELASGEVPRWESPEWEPLTTELHSRVNLEPLDRLAEELTTTFERYDSAIDAWLAPRLRRAIPISRREASEPGIWRYLAVVRYPEIIRHRWELLSWPIMRQRFWSFGTRHDSNTFARLWWIAELTREGDNYELTEKALGRQSLAIQIFVRSWSSHRPAVEASVERLGDAPAEVIERAARELSRHLATVPLEGLDRADIAGLIDRVVGVGR